MMIPQNKNVRQLVWNLYIYTALEGSELFCYNTESDRNSVVSQASCRICDRLEQRAYIRMPVLRGRNPTKCYSELVRKGVVFHGFHKLIVTFSLTVRLF